ncbi:Spp2/MOS2, G-patch domain [Sesbania bispinosa]|nr:Spp2/MOS2, G-patch domain [Sesbania bispinosa]
MKLSFSIPSSKSSSKPNSIKPSHTFDDSSSKQDPSTSKHLITEFDPSKPPTLETKTLIPPIQNEWRPLKKMKNLDLPITESNPSQSLAFEHDTSSAADEPGSDMSYGLNLRHNSDKNKPDADDEESRVLQRRVAPETVLLQKLKDDLKRLPEDQGFDEFKDVPVEGFGAALLAGYGWSEGMGIGKNAKEDVKVVEYQRRTAKEGLGFVAEAPAPIRRNKEKEGRGGTEESGKKEKEEKIVRIVGGRDAGLKGSVVSRIGNDYLVLKLSGSGDQVKVRMDDVAELGSVEEERCLKKLKELKIRSRNDDKGSKSKRGRDGVEEKKVDVSVDRRREEQGRKQVSWLTSHIRVRVISRDFKGGRLYLKKGEVLDVVGPTTCDISMDESREIIQGVSQDILETALPRRGGAVLVLYGKHKGAYGSLVERDLDREIGIVRDADTHELLNVKLEQIAEYIGDPNLLGH